MDPDPVFAGHKVQALDQPETFGGSNLSLLEE